MFNHMHGRGCGHQGGPRDAAGPRGGRWQRGPFTVEWSFEGGEGPGGRPGGRGRRMFDGGELRLVLLKLIADEPRHGYDLIRRIEDLTGGAYAPSPGVVYPSITMLDDMGLIAEQHSEGAKKRFAATEDGLVHLTERAEQVEALMARLAALAEHRERTDHSAARRAMGNLGQVVRGKLHRGDVPDEQLHEIVAMIDAVAQQIERLK